jgi:hypothetical protein
MGNFNEFLKSNYESMLSQMPAKVVRSQEYMDKFNLYRDAYDKMGFGNPQPTLAPGTAALNPIPQDPGAIQGLLGSGGGANFGPAGPMPNTPGVDYDAQANPFGPQEGVMPEIDNIGLITNAPGYNPVTPQQPTGGFDSKAFANELLTGIGDLFKQHFPESAQMAFNNSNQMQSQIEQPIQDATTFDVQPQQNMAFNPFSVNTLGGSFGGGY